MPHAGDPAKVRGTSVSAGYIDACCCFLNRGAGKKASKGSSRLGEEIPPLPSDIDRLASQLEGLSTSQDMDLDSEKNDLVPMPADSPTLAGASKSRPRFGKPLAFSENWARAPHEASPLQREGWVRAALPPLTSRGSLFQSRASLGSGRTGRWGRTKPGPASRAPLAPSTRPSTLSRAPGAWAPCSLLPWVLAELPLAELPLAELPRRGRSRSRSRAAASNPLGRSYDRKRKTDSGTEPMAADAPVFTGQAGINPRKLITPPRLDRCAGSLPRGGGPRAWWG